MIFLRIILSPLLPFYYLFILIKNILYDNNILKQYRSSVKIISVGNISTGGTGKTPFAIFLIDFLLKRNKKVCIISRGYKRKSNNLKIGFDGKNVLGTPIDLGDELAMIINRYKNNYNNFYAIASANRIEGVKFAEQNFKPDFIILDDAFQHRKVFRNLDIVLINNETNNLLDKILLPLGNLREPVSSLKRSDILINNYKFNRYVLKEDKSGIGINFVIEGFYNFKFEKLSIDNKSKIILISGIANNTSFENIISKEFVNICTNKFFYYDHYNYTDDDINLFINSYIDNSIFLTTEKDFIKLSSFENFVNKFPVYYCKIDVEMDIKFFENLLIEKNIL